jgi:dTDP-4-amino-4,6-dideoxygalactose transaminase
MEQIPVFKPALGKEELNACKKVLDIGWLGMGADVGEFENRIKQYLHADDRFIAAVSTGHAALHLGLLVAGVKKGDEVITPAFNNIADFQAILATGAKPVFCDIDQDTLCIDFDKAEKLVSKKTKSCIIMDYDCCLCDHDRAAKFAEDNDIRIIHDAAHAFGSKYKGKMIGSFSDICMFSFDPVKTITCNDGGVLVVKTEEELKTIQEMRLIGMTQPTNLMYNNQRAWTYDVKKIGFRYHMSNLHAAIGLAQLKKIKEISETRRAACQYYNKNLSNIPELTVPKTDFKDITPFLYYIRVPSEKRDSLRKYLLETGVDTGIHWQPGHWFTLLKKCKKGDLSVTDKIGREILSLPLHSFMSQKTIELITSKIKNFFEA